MTELAAGDRFIVPVILAIDPGTIKIGWAVVEERGKPVKQGILILERGVDRLGQLVNRQAIRTVVLGDGTNRVNIEAECKRLFPQADIVVIDEKNSTVEGWKLKRKEEVGRDPFRGLWFTLVQLFTPGPVDDYAARILAQRFIERRDEAGHGDSGDR